MEESQELTNKSEKNKLDYNAERNKSRYCYTD